MNIKYTILSILTAIILCFSLADRIVNNNDQYNYLISGLTHNDDYSLIASKFIKNSPNEDCRIYEIATIKVKYPFNYPMLAFAVNIFKFTNINIIYVGYLIYIVNFILILSVILSLIYEASLNYSKVAIMLGFFNPKLLFISIFNKSHYTDYHKAFDVVATIFLIYFIQRIFNDLTIARMVSIFFGVLFINSIERSKLNYFYLIFMFTHLFIGTLILLGILFYFKYSFIGVKRYIFLILISSVSVIFIATSYSSPYFHVNPVVFSLLFVSLLYVSNRVDYFKRMVDVLSNKLVFYILSYMLIRLNLLIDATPMNPYHFINDYIICPVLIIMCLINYNNILLPIKDKYIVTYFFYASIMLVSFINIINKNNIVKSFQIYSKYDKNQTELKNLECGTQRRYLFFKELFKK
jgi:hypothetical protein